MFFDTFNSFNPRINFIMHAAAGLNNQTQDYSSHQILQNELFFKFPGENLFTFNSQSHLIKAPTVGFIPKIPYSEKIINYTIQTKKSSTSINIFFDCDVEFEPYAQFFDCSNIPDIASLFEKFENTWNFQNVGYYTECMSYFYKIAATMQKHLSPSYLPNHKYNIISQSLEYIKKNFLLPDFNYMKLAEISGISYSYYKKIFTMKFNMTPNQYVGKLKLNYASNLLKSHLYSVTEIAELCGYSSVYYFSHVFTKEFGMSPKKWIQRKSLSESTEKKDKSADLTFRQ